MPSLPPSLGSSLRSMRARDPEQTHRAATPLELFFDLTIVVAVSLAAEGLAARLADGHGAGALGSYLLVFFAIWWGWLNFTWFASAYDTDDWLYRLVTLVQMAGALTVAAGIPDVVASSDFTIVVVGYVIMRIALVIQWLRAGRSDQVRRPTALRYAAGVSVVQTGWVLFLFPPAGTQHVLLPVLIVADMLVPVFAERGRRTTYHPGHIVERYGLFTLIVLGEGVLASGNAVIAAIHEGGHVGELVVLAACGLVVLAGMWWFYFEVETDDAVLIGALPTAIGWGYGHYLVFASAAAVSSGIELQVEQITGHSHAGRLTTSLLLGVPIAVFVLTTWAIVMRRRLTARLNVAIPAVALAAVAVPLLPWSGTAIPICEAVLVVALVAALVTGRPAAGER